ncbi:MAG: CocE/NonD family hydrolase [Pseudomonadota bacterium]
MVSKSVLFSCIGAAFIGFLAYLFLFDHRPPLTLETGPDFAGTVAMEPLFDSHSKTSYLLPMADGIELAVDVFVPTDGDAAVSQFPVVFKYTPYGRSHLVPGMPLWQRVVAKLRSGQWGPVFDATVRKGTRVYLSQGYAYVIADMRGSGASDGSHFPLDSQFALDGKALVDWIASQSWSNGKVCMEGQSYTGWSQYAIASQKPEALKCIAPALIMAESFTGGARPGGITSLRWIDRYSELLANATSYAPDPEASDKMFPVAPVVDEDGDGELEDEIPIDFEGDAPIYRDRVERSKHVYARGILERRNNLLPRDFLGPDFAYIDATRISYGRVIDYPKQSPAYMLQHIDANALPIYHLGGWFDGFSKGTTKLYASTQYSPLTKLMIAPRFHRPTAVTEAYADYLGFEGNSDDQLIYESLRFFDHHLKDIDNGIYDEKPIKLYVMHRGWRQESEWPLARQSVTPFYFASNHSLVMNDVAANTRAAREDEGVDTYAVDWSHSSSYSENQSNRWIMMEAPTGVMDRTVQDQKTLTYDTPALTNDTEVTGHPIVNLWLSSNQVDADVHVYLTDVDTQGRSVYVSEGHIRAGWSELFEDDDQVLGAIDVKPELPWQGYRSEQYKDAPLANGRIVKLRVDLDPTSWVFQTGHKIRIAISGTDTGNFDLNEVVCPQQRIESCAETTLSLHRSEEMRSNVELPLIP